MDIQALLGANQGNCMPAIAFQSGGVHRDPSIDDQLHAARNFTSRCQADINFGIVTDNICN